jgi:hypothetical protein
MEITIQMSFERSTKNKHRFVADDPAAAVSELYIAKSYMLAPLPTIKVTIKTQGGENAGEHHP